MKLSKIASIALLFIAPFITLNTVHTAQAATEYNVAIIQLIDNSAFADMREGFINQMRAKGYDESKMTFHDRNAQGDSTNLNTICQEIADSGYDLAVAIATPAAQAMVNMESDVPTFFISVANPLAARVISDMNKPDKNATGTSNAIPTQQIFELAATLSPEAKTFGMIYNTGEVNAVSTIEKAKEYLDAKGLKYEESIVTNSAEVQQAAQSLADRVDAFYIPNDSVLQSAMPLVSEVANDAKLPVYCASTATVLSGGLATVAISDIKIGAITADMAIEYLNGKKIEEIPAQVVPATDTVINEKTAKIIGLTIPSDIKGLITIQ